MPLSIDVMGEAEEKDILHMSGLIEGFLLHASFHFDEDKHLDRERWEALYGARVLYSSVPSYPSEEAKLEGRDGLSLTNWDDATETKHLKDDARLPDDRGGTLVFEEGIVVSSSDDGWEMFTLDELDTIAIEIMDRRLLEIIRDAYDYYDRE